MITRFAISALLASFSAGAVFAQDKITYQNDWLHGGDAGWIYVCVHHGFCADAGLDVTILPGRGGADAYSKVASGVAEVGQSQLETVMLGGARENGPVSAVMSIFTQHPGVFMMLDNSGIDSFEDLSGKTVAVVPFGSSRVFAGFVLDSVGLTDSVTVELVEPSAMGALLATGQVDALGTFVNSYSRWQSVVQQTGQDVIGLPWFEAGFEMYSTALIVNDAFAAAQPDTVRRLIGAIEASIAFGRENPEAVGEAVAAIVPELSPTDATNSWNDVSSIIFTDHYEEFGPGAFDAARVSQTWALTAQSQDMDEETFDPETVIDRSFLARK